MANSLSVREKEHWKERIAKRIDEQIERLCFENPGFMDRIVQSATEKGLDSLGIAKLHARLETLEQERRVLDSKEDKTQKEMIAKLRGVPLREVSDIGSYTVERELAAAVSKRRSIHEDELLAKTPVGRKILTLRKEKDHLLDTVWLATSPKQIKDLWMKVDEMLGGEQTKLLQEALSIEAVKENE